MKKGAPALVILLSMCTGQRTPEPARPAAIPEGWTYWGDRWNNCNLWIAEDPARLAAPIVWEPCAFATPFACRQIQLTQHTFGRAAFFDASTGTPHLLFTRVAKAGAGDSEPAYAEAVVAEVDGPAKFALRIPSRANTCGFIPNSFAEGHHAYVIAGDGVTPYDAETARPRGLVLGRIESPIPSVVYAGDPGEPQDAALAVWSAGSSWIARMDAAHEIRLHTHDFATDVFLTSPAVDAQAQLPLIFGTGGVYEVGAQTSFKAIMSFDPAAGTRPLQRWAPGDPRGAGNLGSDGRHLVWTYGEGRAEGHYLYPRRSIMTAPYTTDPAQLRPRRLRSDPGTELDANRFAVGCGYAGHDAHPPRDQLVVHLADGRAWTIAAVPRMAWLRVLGFTCDEVFLSFATERGWNVARVALDSLGDGQPP